MHRRVFQNLYWFGLMVAGLFNFLPGRAINRALLSDAPEFDHVLIALGPGTLLLMVFRPLISLLPLTPFPKDP